MLQIKLLSLFIGVFIVLNTFCSFIQIFKSFCKWCYLICKTNSI
nr:MAG TPA: hypothetical protein [Crassvirales sp.]